MHGDGFILSEHDLEKYNGHEEIHKYCLYQGATEAVFEKVPENTCTDSLKEWLRPTKICAENLERWKATPALRILMIKTKNEFSRNPLKYTPTHRTIPGCTEVEPHANREEHIKLVKEVFRHARLPLAALGAYIQSNITFLSAPTYEVFDKEGTSGGQVTKYYCSGTSWSIAWSYFHATRHTSAVLFYREGDGVQRRDELIHEILRLKQHVAHPMLLAFVKTQISLVWTFNLLKQMNSEVFEIEKGVGLAVWDWCLDRPIEAAKDPEEDEVVAEENTAKAQKKAVELYNIQVGKLINIRFRLRAFREQIDWLRRMNSTYLKSLDDGSTHAARKRECDELDTVLDRLEDFRQVYQHDSDTLYDRLRSQMKSMAALISQRDSRIGLAIADVNNELAWQGKNTNHALMAIAVASFIFLPATFIASVFDAPIFRFGQSGSEIADGIITKPFWIFWMSCGLTTAFACLCWLLYIRKKRTFEQKKRLEAKKAFRRKIMRTPTLEEEPTESTEPNSTSATEPGWFNLWNWRLRRALGDEEKEIGIGAVRAVSFDKTA